MVVSNYIDLKSFNSDKKSVMTSYFKKTLFNEKRLKPMKIFYFNKMLKKSHLGLKKKRSRSAVKQDRRYKYHFRKYGTFFDYDVVPLVNAIRRKIKFQQVSMKFFRRSRIYFRYTGSNIFGTITNNLGEVAFVYSSGIFKGLDTRKEKTTIFVAQQLGELISLRMYKTNAREIYFIPFINHTKARTLLRFFILGLKFIKLFKITRVVIKRKVMRNGVRLAKPPRK